MKNVIVNENTQSIEGILRKLIDELNLDKNDFTILYHEVLKLLYEKKMIQNEIFKLGEVGTTISLDLKKNIPIRKVIPPNFYKKYIK